MDAGYPPHRRYGRLIAHTADLWSGAAVRCGIYDQGRCSVELEALVRVFGGEVVSDYPNAPYRCGLSRGSYQTHLLLVMV